MASGMIRGQSELRVRFEMGMKYKIVQEVCNVIYWSLDMV